MTIEELRAEIKRIEGEVHLLNRSRCNLKGELADKLTRFRIGQRVIHKKKEYEIVGYSLWGHENNIVEYYGKQILKSGALHKNRLRLYEGYHEPMIMAKDA